MDMEQLILVGLSKTEIKQVAACILVARRLAEELEASAGELAPLRALENHWVQIIRSL